MYQYNSALYQNSHNYPTSLKLQTLVRLFLEKNYDPHQSVQIIQKYILMVEINMSSPPGLVSSPNLDSRHQVWIRVTKLGFVIFKKLRKIIYT